MRVCDIITEKLTAAFRDQIKLAEVPPGDEKDIPPAALAAKKNYQPDMPEMKKREIMTVGR